MHKRIYLYAVLCLFFALPAKAEMSIIKAHIPNAQIVGEGRFTYMIFDLYDATLYAPKANYNNNLPFALSLKYLRNLKGEKIARQSVKEMRKQGFEDEKKLENWYEQMASIFPDVKEGTILTGMYMANKTTRFYNGSEEIGTIKDPDFGPWFFGIWLSDNTSAPKLRQDLIGKK